MKEKITPRIDIYKLSSKAQSVFKDNFLTTNRGKAFLKVLPKYVTPEDTDSLLIQIKKCINNFQRVYLIFVDKYSFFGVFHSIRYSSLIFLLKKYKNPYECSRYYTRMAAYGTLQKWTMKWIHEIDLEECPSIPPSLLISIGNHLLAQEGLGFGSRSKKF